MRAVELDIRQKYKLFQWVKRWMKEKELYNKVLHLTPMPQHFFGAGKSLAPKKYYGKGQVNTTLELYENNVSGSLFILNF